MIPEPDYRRQYELSQDPRQVRADLAYLMEHDGVNREEALARAISMCAIIRRVQDGGGDVWLSHLPSHRPRAVDFH